MPSGIRYFGSFEENGVGYAARGYLEALRCLGYDEKRVRIVSIVGRGLSQDSKLRDYHYNDAHDGVTFDTSIVHASPVNAWRYIESDAKRRILITYWETTKLPEGKFAYRYENGNVKDVDIVELMRTFDDIWVPSVFVQEVFDQYKLKTRLVPHVLHEDVLNKAEKITDSFAPLANESVRFYNIGTWDVRKNPQAFVRAITSLYTTQSKVEVMLHLLPAIRERDAVRVHANVFSAEFRKLLEPCKDPPRFGCTVIPRSRGEILSLHLGGHVFVSTSRGEAVCYDALIALAFNKYVIGSGPVFDELYRYAPNNVFVVPSRRIPVIADPNYLGYDIDQDWYDPIFDALKERVKSVEELCRTTGGQISHDEWLRHTPEEVASLMEDING